MAKGSLDAFDSQRRIAFDEVRKHITADDCWVVIDNAVYDVSDFLKLHPGGPQAVLAEAGKDATEIFRLFHRPEALDTLPPEARLGLIDQESMPAPSERVSTEAETLRQRARKQMPLVHNMLLLRDFELWAGRVLSEKAWAYYRSAADEERSYNENMAAFRRYFFRPRMFRDMTTGSTQTSFLGIQSTLPIFISPAAMAKLGHPLGEVNLTRAAGKCGIVQAISANASCSLEEIFAVKKEGQSLIYQIYIDKVHSSSERILQTVERLGARAIILTVDCCWWSKRTLDNRAKDPVPASSLGLFEAMGGLQDRNLSWDLIPLIRRNTKLPIIVKGIQCLEDVELCIDHGVEGVIISNHGGRQAEYAPAPIDILYEIRTYRPDFFDKIEILIDGGIRSGADVVKALALGAKAVGIGRPILYANGTHGEEGVKRVIEILGEEVINNMRNIGAATISDLKPEMVGPAGPWVGANRPGHIPTLPKL